MKEQDFGGGGGKYCSVVGKDIAVSVHGLYPNAFAKCRNYRCIFNTDRISVLPTTGILGFIAKILEI